MASVFLVSILPGILWLFYFYRKDLYEPEPKKLIGKVFLGGMLMVLPAGYLEGFGRDGLALARESGDFFLIFFYSLFLIGLIEEGLKFLVLGFVLRPFGELDEPVDGIIYGITVGLGFAALENLLYTQALGIQVGLWRAVVTSLAHAAFTGWGARLLTRSYRAHRFRRFLGGWGLAFFFHGLYDFLLLTGLSFLSWSAFLLAGALLYLLLREIHRTVSASPFRTEKG